MRIRLTYIMARAGASSRPRVHVHVHVHVAVVDRSDQTGKFKPVFSLVLVCS